MALSREDKQDVRHAMGKALANRIHDVTRDSNYKKEKSWMERGATGTSRKSTRTHFMGVGTKLEEGKKGKLHGVYHGTKVATRNKRGDLHFRTGGWMTPTTARRMETFASEHGGRDIKISRAKGRLTAYENGKPIARSGEKHGEHLMTIRNRALARRAQ